ncbi:unnamed protein product, partial [Polarella glacialis]
MTASRLASSLAMVKRLVGLLDSGQLPLAMALSLFEVKVEGSLRFGRWLWGLHAAARDSLDAVYQRLAKMFLGAESWRNGAVACGKFGWLMSGSARCVLDIALLRARFWSEVGPGGTLAGVVFLRAHGSAGNTWARLSLALISKWNVPDWPQGVASGPLGQQVDFKSYSRFCQSLLEDKCLILWRDQAKRHKLP